MLAYPKPVLFAKREPRPSHASTRRSREARRAAMAAARADTVLAFNVVAAPGDGLQARKKLERALHEWFQGERCRRFVLFGPGGAGKSTLAVKFAAAQVERGGDGGLRLVFMLSASSMEPDYAGLLGPCPRLARLCHESRSVKTDGA